VVALPAVLNLWRRGAVFWFSLDVLGESQADVLEPDCIAFCISSSIRYSSRCH
jgi:hypothetical protein